MSTFRAVFKGHVKECPKLSFQEYKNKYCFVGERAAACYCCQNTVSGMTTTDAMLKLESHYNRTHAPVPGTTWCDSCCKQVGGIKQLSAHSDHESVRTHRIGSQREISTVCVTCCAVNPPSSHNKAHKVLDFGNVLRRQLAKQTREEPDADEDVNGFIAVMSGAHSSHDGLYQAEIPCKRCYRVNAILSELITEMYASGPCRIGQVFGRKNCGNGRVVTFSHPTRIVPIAADTVKAFKPYQTKTEWTEMPDAVQDLYSLKRGVATLDSQAAADFLKQNPDFFDENDGSYILEQEPSISSPPSTGTNSLEAVETEEESVGAEDLAF